MHERTHNGEKSYGCKQSGEGFPVPVSLKYMKELTLGRNLLDGNSVEKPSHTPMTFEHLNDFKLEKSFGCKPIGNAFCTFY
jgi:hypothetical protein